MALSPNDPGGMALRRAARTAIVLPLVFGLCLVVLDRKDMAVFAAFGSFALLALADFGGPTRTRATAYLTATAIGAALVALATPVSDRPWAGALLMVLVGAVLAFSGVLGGYASAGSGAVTLAFVLAVTVPAQVGDIPARLAGWIVGGLSATIAAVVLWPSHPSDEVRRKGDSLIAATVDVLEQLAGSDDPTATSNASRDRMHDALDELDATVRAMPHRPLGPTAREQALAYLIDELRVLTRAIDDVVEAATGPLTPVDREMLRAVIDLLDQATSNTPPDLVGFEQRFELHRDRTGTSLVEAVRRGVAGEQLAAVLDRTFRVRTVGTAAMSVGANVMLVDGTPLPETTTWISPPAVPPMQLRGSIRRELDLAIAQVRPDSVWFRNAARAGIGLGIAVLIAGVASLTHGFWVALATLSVLKSSAVGTRHTAVQAFLGTCAGFVVASLLSVAIGDRPVILWIALPLCVFVAVYTPTAVRFVVGQAMFTVLVVVLFNLIEPEGWRVGEARVEDIAVGAATAFVVGVLLWPRGAGTALRSSLGKLYAASADFLAAAIDDVVGRTSPGRSSTNDLEVAARAASLQTGDAFRTFLDERGPKHVPVHSWASMITTGSGLPYAAASLIAPTRSLGPVRPASAAAERLAAAGTDLTEALREIAAAIDERRMVADTVFDEGRRTAFMAIARDDLDALVPADAVDHVEQALRVAWTADRLASTDRALRGLRGPLEDSAIGRRPWWR